jgi:hypothetical protein
MAARHCVFVLMFCWAAAEADPALMPATASAAAARTPKHCVILLKIPPPVCGHTSDRSRHIRLGVPAKIQRSFFVGVAPQSAGLSAILTIFPL